METIRIQFEPKIKAKILELLKTFSSEELQMLGLVSISVSAVELYHGCP